MVREIRHASKSVMESHTRKESQITQKQYAPPTFSKADGIKNAVHSEILFYNP